MLVPGPLRRWRKFIENWALYSKAFKALKHGTRLNPSYLPGYLSLGSCYYDMNHFDSAYLAVSPFIDSTGVTSLSCGFLAGFILSWKCLMKHCELTGIFSFLP